MKKILPLFFAAIMSVQAFAQNKNSTLENLEQGNLQMQPEMRNPTATLKSAARLFGEKNDLTTVIMIIPSGTTVQVLDDTDSTYYNVSFEDNKGYILKRQATIDKTPAKTTNDINYSQQADEIENSSPGIQQNTRSRYSLLQEKYGTGIAARINSGKIWKGMTPEMVKDSWGSPQRINRIINGNTMNEQWTYKNTVLYFRDNSLVEWGALRK